MNKIQNEQWIKSLPDNAVSVAEEINIEIAKIIAERIKTIGKLSPSDVKKLTSSIEFLGADFSKITKLIAKLTNQGQMAVVDTLQTLADGNDEFAQVFYSAKGIAAHTWRNDEYLNNLVESIARQTAAEFENLSNTLAYKIDDRTLSLRQMYTRTVDRAIYEAQSGTIDYYTAMRKSIRQLSGDIRVLEWESGTVRRLDSHIRQNLLDGIRQLNQQMLDYHGEKYGSDGVELSVHAISAPDHAPIQGRQFSNEQFYRMQNQMSFSDVNGNSFPAMPRRIGEWNCRHICFPILLGISKPVHTEEQLKEFEKNSAEKYDKTQEQRKMENKLRKLKNERLIASAAGDDLQAKRIQRKINEQQKALREFSRDNDLVYDTKRATVEGYRPISVKDNSLTNDNNSGIINTRGEGKVDLQIDEFTPCLKDAKTGKIVQTTFKLANQEDLKSLRGWKFDWNDKSLKNTEIYKLTLKGNSEIQGLISLSDEKKDNAIHINIAESAPDNLGKNKKYEGVGGHLFAIAIQKSVERGYGGFVFMEAKNEKLVKYYSKKLGAILIGGVHPYRMIIDEESANKLLKIYTLGE